MYGLPAHCRTKAVGRKIAGEAGEVVDVALFMSKHSQTAFLKALVEFDVNETLMEGIIVESGKDGNIWVDLKYERLCQFCYYCSKIGPLC